MLGQRHGAIALAAGEHDVAVDERLVELLVRTGRPGMHPFQPIAGLLERLGRDIAGNDVGVRDAAGQLGVLFEIFEGIVRQGGFELPAPFPPSLGVGDHQIELRLNDEDMHQGGLRECVGR